MTDKHKLFITLLAISSFAVGCAKETSNKEFLVDKQWFLVKSNVEPAMRGTNDYIAVAGDCVLDDVEVYHANGEYTWNKGDNICEAEYEGLKEVNGTWTLNDEMTEITILDEEEYPFIFKIESLNDSIMVVSHIEEYEKPYKFTDTYKTK